MISNNLSEIWLVRHGQSESNANLTTLAPEATRLTTEGWEEARIFAGFLDKKPAVLATNT